MSTMIDVREQQERDAASTSSNSSSHASPHHKASTTQTTSSAEVVIELLLLALAAKGELGADCAHGTRCSADGHSNVSNDTSEKKKLFF
jgi:hypothetical protein